MLGVNNCLTVNKSGHNVNNMSKLTARFSVTLLFRQPSIAVLMVLTIAICPLMCVQNKCCSIVGTGKQQVAKKPVCSCCQKSNQTNESRQDQSPKPGKDCPCGDCVCKGALSFNKAEEDCIAICRGTDVFCVARMLSTHSGNLDGVAFCSTESNGRALPAAMRAHLGIWIL